MQYENYLRIMFTGIVQGLGEIKSIDDRSGLRTIVIKFDVQQSVSLKLGASVAIDGVCLSVMKIDGDEVVFELMGETLLKTTLRDLKVGDKINIERSAILGDEIGGHIMSGHVSSTAEIITIEEPENNHVITFRAPSEMMKYILSKGFIGLDGCSLTVVDVDKNENTFSVWLISETLRVTTFKLIKIGDRVNLEIDSQTQAIVDTVENFLKINVPS